MWPKYLQQTPKFHNHRILSWTQPLTSKDLRADLGPHVISDVPWSSARGTVHLRCINESILLNRIYFLERSSAFYWTVNFTIRYSICQMGSMVTRTCYIVKNWPSRLSPSFSSSMLRKGKRPLYGQFERLNQAIHCWLQPKPSAEGFPKVKANLTFPQVL